VRRALVLLITAVLVLSACSQSSSDEDPGKSAGANADQPDTTQTTAAPEQSSSAASGGSGASESAGAGSISSAAAGEEYLSYANARFGFRCEVPGYFAADEGAVNGDGRGFTSPDFAVRVVCSGLNNVDRSTAAEAFAEAQQSLTSEGATVTYKVIRGDTFALSGLGSDGNLYYQRTVWGRGSSNTLLWTYPPEQKADLDPAVAHSAESFRPGDVTTSH